MNTTSDDALFEDYLADRLSVDDAARLKQLLAHDRTARARFVEVLQEWQLLAESARQITVNSCPIVDDSANTEGVKRRRPSRSLSLRSTPRRSRHLFLQLSALAATLVVALWFIRPTTTVDSQGVVGMASVGVHIVRGKDRMVAKAGAVLLPGDQVRVGDRAQARIDFADKTTVQLDQRTEIQLASDGSGSSEQGKRIVLTAGRVTADVSKQPAGRPMVFTTPNAKATVLGTVLTLEFNSAVSITRLDVTEGLVALGGSIDQAKVEVPSGHFATVAANTQTVVRPLVASTVVAHVNYRPGLRATYFAGTELEEQILSRIEPGIRTDPGLESVPLSERRTNFSVRWNGFLQPLFSEKYLLTLHSDGGTRLYLDDRLVIDAWGAERFAYHQATVMLDASKRHALRVEYRQPKSGMKIKLDWASANQQPETIPVERLSTDK